MTDLQQLGATISERRRALRLTQEALAERAHLHPIYVALLETGKKNVTFAVLLKIAAALETDLCQLMCSFEEHRRTP